MAAPHCSLEMLHTATCKSKCEQAQTCFVCSFFPADAGAGSHGPDLIGTVGFCRREGPTVNHRTTDRGYQLQQQVAQSCGVTLRLEIIDLQKKPQTSRTSLRYPLQDFRTFTTS